MRCIWTYVQTPDITSTAQTETVFPALHGTDVDPGPKHQSLSTSANLGNRPGNRHQALSVCGDPGTEPCIAHASSGGGRGRGLRMEPPSARGPKSKSQVCPFPLGGLGTFLPGSVPLPCLLRVTTAPTSQVLRAEVKG